MFTALARQHARPQAHVLVRRCAPLAHVRQSHAAPPSGQPEPRQGTEPARAGLLAKIREGQWPKGLTKERITAPLDYNRWRPVVPSFILQISIGSVYAWSMWNEPLTRQLGVVAIASGDWSLGQVLPVWSTAAMALGVCTFFLGPWAEKAGPRMVGMAAATSYGLGCALSGLGCSLHCLPMVYVGYGVLGGIGWGLGYISPVSTLMRWFPDRRGLATGLALTAFGGGAAVAAPVIKTLTSVFERAPQYLGRAADVDIVIQQGKQFVQVGAELKEVVVATAADLTHISTKLSEGVYVVGTGSTGAAGAFVALGAIYFTTMSLGALGARVPHPSWRPKGWEPQTESKTSSALVTTKYIDHKQVLTTPQFYYLWAAVLGNAIAGTALISSAKIIMGDIFGTLLPAIVTGAFASTYVAALSMSNSAGRLGWAVASDFLGRKNTYFLFGLALPICASVPMLTAWATASPTVAPLALFYGGTLLSFSFYGGLFSVLPAYIADVFGQKHVGAIHGRLLTAWSTAALVGPKLLATLRSHSQEAAINQLAASCDPLVFEKTFGSPIEQLRTLIDTNTVTINRLMEIAPVGTVDPTPTLYNSTMYACSGILVVAMLCNARMRPVDPALMKSDGPQPNDAPAAAHDGRSKEEKEATKA